MAKLPTEPPEAVARMMGAYIIHHKGRAAFTFCIYLFASVMGAVVPLQIGAVVDEVVAGKYTEYPWKPLMIIFAATFAEAILICIAMYSASRLGALVTREASIDTIDAALDLDARTVEESGSGDLLTRVTDDLSSASNAVSFDLLEILFVVLYFVVSMASLATLSIPMSLIFLPMIVGLAVLMRHYLPRMAQKNQVVQENTSELNSVLTENVRGAATIRELGVHSSREKVFDDGNRHRFEATLQCSAYAKGSTYLMPSTPGFPPLCACCGAASASCKAGPVGVRWPPPPLWCLACALWQIFWGITLTIFV